VNNNNDEVNIARAVLNGMTDDQVMAAKRFFDRFSEYKKFVKLHSVYIEGARTALANTGNSRIYVKYNIDGTVTGRISNSGANVGRKKTDKIGVSFHTFLVNLWM
jgi:DNA polymerase I-like protein with 3'-5' exonuclease and polymerase domains